MLRAFRGLDGTNKHLFSILQILLKPPKTLLNKGVSEIKQISKIKLIIYKYSNCGDNVGIILYL